MNVLKIRLLYFNILIRMFSFLLLNKKWNMYIYVIVNLLYIKWNMGKKDRFWMNVIFIFKMFFYYIKI